MGEMRLRSYDVCIASTQARAEVENPHAVLVMSDQLAAVSSIQKVRRNGMASCNARVLSDRTAFVTRGIVPVMDIM